MQGLFFLLLDVSHTMPQTSTAILLIRLLAMYGNPRWLKIGLYLTFLAEIILYFILLIWGAISFESSFWSPHSFELFTDP